MLEKEIKILEINKDELIKKLEDLWAIKTFDWVIHDVYYDFPEWKDGMKMEDNQRMFRVRKKWEEHIYTIKRKRKYINDKEWVSAKDEHETSITNIESFSKVLEKYGMKKTRQKIKHRISYKLDGMEFDIDKYENIPAILEIEGNNWDSIRSWVKKLWLKKYKQMLWGSRKLFKYYWEDYLNFD